MCTKHWMRKLFPCHLSSSRLSNIYRCPQELPVFNVIPKITASHSSGSEFPSLIWWVLTRYIIFSYVLNFGDLFVLNPRANQLFQSSLLLTSNVCFYREHDFGDFTYHFKMGPQKFGNPDTNGGEAFGATCYTGKGRSVTLCCLDMFLSWLCHDSSKA